VLKSVSCEEDVTARDLDKICDWIEERGFKLNVKKIKAMVVSRKKNPLVQKLFCVVNQWIMLITSNWV